MELPIQSESIKNLAQALAIAQAELKHAPKNAQNPFFKSNYADLATVIETARPIFTKHGLSIIQSTTIWEGETVVHNVLITTLLHSSGEWIRGYLLLRPQKEDAQSLGSYLTYQRRYSYMAITGLAAEDDDGEASMYRAPNPILQRPPIDGPLLRNGLITEKQARLLEYTKESCGVPDTVYSSLLKTHGVATTKELKFKDMDTMLGLLQQCRKKPSGQDEPKKL